ncbi:hypothetical protein [Pleomorphovibrio marinus]|uniref:hypothetical protein n=1 Tax=Pleomorphovibrio marinus TaxID=2164132 RepID=UPI000E0CACB3|nr:hypothetical protein [Pleomorphovibrio marinus]
MAKTLWVTTRFKENIDIRTKLIGALEAITPDHLKHCKPYTHQEGNTTLGILNPSGLRHLQGTNHILGDIFEKRENWFVPNTGTPEGAFSLFRENGEVVEILSDSLASRTVWYYMDQRYFIASSSQRAILLLLGGRQWNEQVIPWMFSSGTLGPSNSWDTRLKSLDPDSTLSLDKSAWNLKVSKKAVHFDPQPLDEAGQVERLRSSIREVLGPHYSMPSDWVLSISGGVDSRGLLYAVLAHAPTSQEIKTLTWGGKATMKQRESDFYLGQVLAKQANTSHSNVILDREQVPFELLWERFLTNGEGRVDNITGYVDGFGLWEKLHRQGIKGMLRGDEAFGQLLGLQHRENPDFLRFTIGLSLCRDFQQPYFRLLSEAYTQELPASYAKRGEESWYTWRDRLYQEFRMPLVMAALTDLKLAYLEVVNPFLSQSILNAVRNIPDQGRLEKRAFASLVNSFWPEVPYASSGSGIRPSELMQRKDASTKMMDLLQGSDAGVLFPQQFREGLLKDIQNRQGAKFKAKALLKKLLPSPKRGRSVNLDRPMPVNCFQMGLRAMMILDMYQRLGDSPKRLVLPQGP